LTTATGTVLEQLKACMRLLADNGIGTDRTTGHGQFEFDEQTDVKISFNLPDNATHQMSLSLYCPQKTEIEELDNSYYDLIKRGGYIASPQNDNHLSIRKKSVYMFVEGSLFPNSGSRKGKIVDLMPNNVALQESGQSEIGHPIWRDGTSIFLPFTHSQNKA
jgi:CRISPR-associated protein Csm4